MINLEQLVAYLDFEHTRVHWTLGIGTRPQRPQDDLERYSHPPPTTRRVYTTGQERRAHWQSHRYWEVVARGCWCGYMRFCVSFSFLKVSKLKTQSGPARRSFVPRVGAGEDWQRMRSVRVRSGASGRSGEC